MPKKSNKRKNSERELSNAERGKELARPVKEIRREKSRPPLRKVPAPEFISASRLEGQTAVSEGQDDLFSESEEPGQPLGEAKETSDLTRSILNLASEPSLYPLVIDFGSGKFKKARDFDALTEWRVPPVDLLFLHTALVERIIKIRVEAGMQSSKDNAEGQDPADSDPKTGSNPVGGASGNVFTKRKPWPVNESLSVAQLQREIEYCRTCRANGQEIPSAAAFFPDLAGSAVEMKLLLDPKTADDRAAGWRQDSEWQEHPERLFQKLITLLPPDGVKKDVVKQLIAVDLEDSIENATVAYSYMTRMQLVLQEHGYHTGGLRAFPIDQANLALKGIKHKLKSSPSAFLNTVGAEVFDKIMTTILINYKNGQDYDYYTN